MILGVVLAMVAEGLVLESYGVIGLAVFFFVGNSIYFMFSEEPNLK